MTHGDAPAPQRVRLEDRSNDALPPLRVVRVAVHPGRMTCDVQVREGVPRYADASIMGAVLAQRPAVRHHACVNDVGPRFADVMVGTSIPHVLEHVIIDIQVHEACAANGPSCGADADALVAHPSPREQSPSLFVGTTEWVNEAAGTARVEFSFVDDMQAMKALAQALDLLNGILRDHSAANRHRARALARARLT